MTLVLLATWVLGLFLWHPNEDILIHRDESKDAFLFQFLLILHSMMEPNIYQDKIDSCFQKYEKRPQAFCTSCVACVALFQHENQYTELFHKLLEFKIYSLLQ